MSQGIVIGLGSLPGAGKGELAQQLSDLGTGYLHVGTIVRSTAQANGFVPAEETREAYLPFWEEYSKEHGRDWLAKIAFQEVEKTASHVLMDGVRIPGDAYAIASARNGTMVWLESDPQNVGRRVLSRGRAEDISVTDIDEYVAEMQRDLSGEGSFSMGAVRDASGVFLLPIPEIDDLDERASYYNNVARHLLAVCEISPVPTK